MTQKNDLVTKVPGTQISCNKFCGSRQCKDAIKKTPIDAKPSDKKCPGVGIGCVAHNIITQTDLHAANEWLTVGRGDTSWINTGRQLTKGKSRFMNLTT